MAKRAAECFEAKRRREERREEVEMHGSWRVGGITIVLIIERKSKYRSFSRLGSW